MLLMTSSQTTSMLNVKKIKWPFIAIFAFYVNKFDLVDAVTSEVLMDLAQICYASY